jgi:hypothetical protein
MQFHMLEAAMLENIEPLLAQSGYIVRGSST